MRLLKREIQTVNTRVLNTRYCTILQKAEMVPAHKIPAADAREILWIEDQLRVRLLKQLGRDPYPPDRIEKKAPSNYMVSLLKRKQEKPETKPGLKIKFNVVVTSSIGSKAAQFNVEADSKIRAGVLAQKEIRKLGLKRVKVKIS